MINMRRIQHFFINRWTLLIVVTIVVVLLWNKPKLDDAHYYVISSFAIVYTAIVAICDFREKRKFDKLNYAIELVEYFDNKELRVARNFTRNLRKPIESGKYSEDLLLKFIEKRYTFWELLIDADLRYLQKVCKPCGDLELKDSLVYLFNYWQKVYTALEYEAVDKKYIMHHLAGVYKEQYKRFKFWLDYQKENGGDKLQWEDLRKFYDLVFDYVRRQNESVKTHSVDIGLLHLPIIQYFSKERWG